MPPSGRRCAARFVVAPEVQVKSPSCKCFSLSARMVCVSSMLASNWQTVSNLDFMIPRSSLVARVGVMSTILSESADANCLDSWKDAVTPESSSKGLRVPYQYPALFYPASLPVYSVRLKCTQSLRPEVYTFAGFRCTNKLALIKLTVTQVAQKRCIEIWWHLLFGGHLPDETHAEPARVSTPQQRDAVGTRH
jgi:hypothetical protein